MKSVTLAIVFACASSLHASPLSDALKAVAEKCTVDLRYASISGCPAGEDKAVQAIIDKDGVAKS